MEDKDMIESKSEKIKNLQQENEALETLLAQELRGRPEFDEPPKVETKQNLTREQKASKIKELQEVNKILDQFISDQKIINDSMIFGNDNIDKVVIEEISSVEEIHPYSTAKKRQTKTNDIVEEEQRRRLDESREKILDRQSQKYKKKLA